MVVLKMMMSMIESEQQIDKAGYKVALNKFDAAVCEAIAVSQASAGRLSAANVGYGSYVFTQMCGAGMSMIRAVPLTRWVRSDFEDWRFGSVAGHARSLLDGFLLFNYLMEPPRSEAELNARITVMQLNDCTRRLELHKDIKFTRDIEKFENQRSELQARLSGNDYFNSLPLSVQKKCKNGNFVMLDARDEIVIKLGFEKGEFDAIYDLWSQHIHILPLSFFRIEPNGRGTGLENDTDRTYIYQALEFCSKLLVGATNLLVEQFPDVTSVRRGIKSKFSPGPAENKPRGIKPSRAGSAPIFRQSTISNAVKKSLGG